MAQNVDDVKINDDIKLKTKVLIQRRTILLLIIGCTPSNNDALKYILNKNLLVHVKAWLEDILTSRVGGVDLLLHLLNSISMLPVTKIMVTSSKLGKKVAAVEKHKICVGGMNEQAIKERVSKVKEQWSASAKRTSDKSASTSEKKKRSLDTNSSVSMPSSKKSKVGDGAKKTSLSNLLQQVSGTKNDERKSDIPRKKPAKALAVTQTSTTSSASSRSETEKVVTKVEETVHTSTAKGKKNKNRRIRWADDDGIPLMVYHNHGDHGVGKEDSKRRGYTEIKDGKTSWKDRKKRDRLKEKELIQKARKFKLVDKDDSLDTMAMIFSSKWHQPKPLPPDIENPPVQVTSKEVDVQTKRATSVMQVSYLSEDDVPSNPYPLTETEQTMDFNAQSASVPQIIPFFFPQQLPTPAPAPLPAPEKPLLSVPPPFPPNVPPPPILGASPTAASLEVVRSMGLPDFLVGQNIQALQGLVASPGLLNSFVDVNGNYDQLKIMSFIQAMNQQLQQPNIPPPSVPPPILPAPIVPLQMQTPYDHYGGAQKSQYKSIPQSSAYKPPAKAPSGGYRGDQNNTEGNLHLSGYGPTTSTEELLAMFAPYVKVDEVVPKNGFMFLNTNDPDGARRAREALNGVMIGGCPLRINVALRRNKNPAMMNSSATVTKTNQPPVVSNTPLPRNALGQIDFNAVRDDRGNPATKNLFVAGYGQGTSEQQLRDVFSQHTQVTGVVMKSSFSFVNTAEKNSAVLARQALLGTTLNGGSLRINFAKESGRLGTSFDTGYGNQPKRNQAIPNHYGHNNY